MEDTHARDNAAQTQDVQTRTVRTRTATRIVLLAGGLAASIAMPAALAQDNGRGKPPVRSVQPGMQAVPPGGVVQPQPAPDGSPKPALPEAEGTTDTSSQLMSEELVTLSAFTEPVQLSTLVQMVASTLNINVTIKGDVPGAVVFQAPVPVQKKDLLALLDMLLEQQGWSIAQDRFGIFVVAPAGEIKPNITSEQPTTRVFSTPNVRPSAVKPVLDAQLGTAQGQAAARVTYLDELGLIVATDTPRRLQAMEDLLTAVLREFAAREFIRLPLTHISAPVARERALQLIGQAPQPTTNNPIAQMQGINQQQQGGGGVLSNLGERLTVDPQGNALIFRGLAHEIDRVREVLAIIDVRNDLVPRQYFVGSSAQQIANLARLRGLGEVTSISADGSTAQSRLQSFQNVAQVNLGAGGQQQNGIGGPVMVVDEGRGTIIYYGTEQQQAGLDDLIRQIDARSEVVTIEVYKLRNSDAVEVADIIQGLITEQGAVGTSPLLPDGSPGQTRRTAQRNQTQRPQQSSEADPEGSSIDSTAFVIADESNNQVIIKAKAGQQPEFARLIQRLDLRRPQVYVQAQIVAITADDRLRLRFEQQLINASGTGGVLSTNFGLGSLPTGAQPLLNQKAVSGGLTGFTAAIIKSDQVPIVMQALASETDSRIVSSPQLLVDDNETATVASFDSIPVQTVTQGGNNDRDIVSFNESLEAGTSLEVTPKIADGNYLRLAYAIELSSFTSEGTSTQPPNSQRNNLQSDSVTVPDDATVVVGGLVLDSNTKSVAKIPLLGDIPILGALFRDTNKGNRKTYLYVFLTPRILRDSGFADLRLLTRGPIDTARLDQPDVDLPPLTPRMLDIMNARGLATPRSETTPLPAASPPQPLSLSTLEQQVMPISPVHSGAGQSVRGVAPIRRETQPITDKEDGTDD